MESTPDNYICDKERSHIENENKTESTVTSPNDTIGNKSPMSINPVEFLQSYMEMNKNHFMDGNMQCEGNIFKSSNARIIDDQTPYCAIGQKRKNDSENTDVPGQKKSLINTSEDKNINLRRNIRDVMDEKNLDSNTIVAQREESERLARVAEQQKMSRELQKQTAASRHSSRVQNQFFSLTHNGEITTKITDPTEHINISNMMSNETSQSSNSPQTCSTSDGTTPWNITEKNSADCHFDQSPPVSETRQLGDIVTIEDSSSDDDCILLSDEEDDESDTNEDPHNSGLHVNDSFNTPDESGQVVINIGHSNGEEDIYVAPQIAKIIKPHQIGGIRFLYDNIIESTKRYKTSSGFGCILAHSMGLGKTLQIVSFCDVFFRCTSFRRVLCVTPINTLQNWLAEFNMWLPKVSYDHHTVQPRNFDVFVLNDQQKTLTARAKVIFKWAEEGGVLLMGYELFRLLAFKIVSTRKRRNNRNLHLENNGSEINNHLQERIQKALIDPGPDLVICDEGHRIKNAHAGISVALKQIRTRRRIVLTGYPLQNNLLEYWCMVDFVRPNYLGTRGEFCNMFERPIQNGQCIDSTPEDIKLMRYRSHVLHSLLVGFVQRRSHMVLQETLPQKLEYVILIRMTPFQRKLYDTFMNDVVRTKSVPNPLKAFSVCCKIWNHPDVLYNFLRKRETDIDLEIDDNDAVDEISNPSSGTSDPNTAKDKMVKDNVSSSNSSINTGTQLNLNKPTQYNLSNYKTPSSSKTQTSNTNDVSQFNTENNVPNGSGFSSNACQQNSITPRTSDNRNNCWMDSSAPYYFYQSENMGVSSNPDYVGIVVNQTESGISNEYKNTTSSSEIVDLDTKEIKTIETDIDLVRNAVIKNEPSDSKSTTLQECRTEMCNKDKTELALSKDPLRMETTATPASTNERDHASKTKNDDSIPYEWAFESMKTYEPNLISNSPKIEIFFSILNESIVLGDRVLLFSQSLLTLNLIETFLQSNLIPTMNAYWQRNLTYFRLDGSTSSHDREKLINDFNSDRNVKLFLISTKAGSLGINLTGANRVILYDASWNPCHDTQAIYRVYRYGQEKPCYIYRLVMDKCLEKKIYDRQIKKQGMSDRIVDECNPQAHLFMKDANNLCHDYDDVENSKSNDVTFSESLDTYVDSIIKLIIETLKHNLSKEPFQHETLLIDRKEKKLSQAEKRQAHRGYEMEKKASSKQTIYSTITKTPYRICRNDTIISNKPVASIRPMQAIKVQNINKSSSMRATRWIPAEVWERQGMTAQEMTLPLDVVIPTNSSDKSNIILKSGQRVMVLKSSKGIYMQLDSGKIIAIRTSSKTNETNLLDKYHKTEIIDITSEGECVNDSKNDSMEQTTSSKSEDFPLSKTIGASKDDSYTDINKKYSKDWTCLKNADMNKDSAVVDANYTIKEQNKQHILTDNTNDKKPLLNIPLEKTKITSTTMMNSSDKVINIDASQIRKDQSTFGNFKGSTDASIETPQLSQNNKCLALNADEISNEYNMNNNNRKDYMGRSRKDLPVYDDKKNPNTTQVSKEMKCLQLDNKMLTQPRHNQYSAYNTKKDSNLLSSHQYKQTQLKDDKWGNSKTFQGNYPANFKINNEESAKMEAGSDPLEYLSKSCQSSQHNSSHISVPVQMSQYSALPNEQQHSKLQIYMPPYNMQFPPYNNSVTTAHNNIDSDVTHDNNLLNTSYHPSRRSYNYTQYYDNVLENNAMLYPSEYPTQFTDYHTYNTLGYSHHHPHYNTNAYESAPPAPVGSNSYHQMHWSPYSSFCGQSNNTRSPVLFPNTTHSTQWHK